MEFHFDHTNRFSRPRRAAEMSHNRMVPRRLPCILIQIPHRIPIQFLHGTITTTPGAGASTTTNTTTHCICLTRATCPCPISRIHHSTTTTTKQQLKNLFFHLFLFTLIPEASPKLFKQPPHPIKKPFLSHPRRTQPDTAIGNVTGT